MEERRKVMTDKNAKRRTNFQQFKPIDVDAPIQTAPSRDMADTQSIWKEVVAMEYMSVRTAPNPTAEVLLYLTRGRTYMVELSGKPWLKVKHPKLGDQIGYVSCTILNDQPVKK
jgi:hypothetical protein